MKTFEESFAELENTVRTLEGGRVPLEKATELYEKGVNLAVECGKILKEAELKVQTLEETVSKQLQLSDTEDAE